MGITNDYLNFNALLYYFTQLTMCIDQQTELIEATYAAGQSRMRADVLNEINKLPFTPEIIAVCKAVLAIETTPFYPKK